MRNWDRANAFFVWVVFFGMGFYFSLRSFDFGSSSELISNTAILRKIGNSEFSTSGRKPSAIRKDFDFSDLEGMPLDYATKQRILSGMEFKKEDHHVGIAIGNFVIKNEQGEKAFACEKYKKIQLTFDGEGQASNGQKPVMVIEGSCEISNDVNQMKTIWVPVQNILEAQPSAGDFEFKGDRPVTVVFDFINDSWPTTWSLSRVRLYEPQEAGKEVILNKVEIDNINPIPIILEF